MKIWIFFFSVLLFLQFGVGIAQESADFPQVEELIISIRLNRGDILFSEKFNKYLDGFNRLKSVQEQRDLTETERLDLALLNQLFGDLNKRSELLKPYMSSILEARDKALYHAADDFAPELFRAAEKNLQKLTEKFTNNSQTKTGEAISEAILLYREAEFDAVRNKLLSEVRILITEAKDLKAEKYTPRSYKKVNELFEEVENILAARQFDDPTLGQKAADLLEESKHLLYIIQLAQQLNREDAAFEDYLLSLEDAVENLNNILAISSFSANGMERALINIGQSIEDLQAKLNQQRTINENLLDSLTILSEKIAVLKIRLGESQNIQRKLENLKAELSPQGIKVMHQDGYILLRANGLQFPLGRLQISPEEKIRLESIGESLRAFPSAQIVVRVGQTTAGNAEYSQKLAEQRAQAVTLVIQSVGYIQDSRIRSEAVLLDNNRETGHAIVDVIISLPE
ncbi:MAG: OmpA family protein [Calditrichia bacterium]|nr:OmpA family protein [Calditrichia bacterium]